MVGEQGVGWPTGQEMKAEIERLHRQLQGDLQESLEGNLRLLLVEVKVRIRRAERKPRLAKHDPVGQDWRKAHDEDGVPMREIARQTGLNPSTVMRRIRTARSAHERLAAEVDVGSPAGRPRLDPQ